MQSSNAPNKIQLPFAASGTKNTIPVPSQQGVTPGAASFTDGFPPLTFTPLSAGGVPPAGADFNGILNAITTLQQWKSAGGQFPYDATFATAIGGYPKGATVLKADGTGLWISTAENNTANPDTGGAGWLAFSASSIQSAAYNTAPDTGVANAYAITLSPAPAVLQPGMTVTILNIQNSNTGASTLNANGLGAIPIYLQGGFPVPPNAILAGASIQCVLNGLGNAWTLVNSSLGQWGLGVNGYSANAYAPNVTYTNTQPWPIFVSAFIQSSSVGHTQLLVNGSIVAYFDTGNGYGPVNYPGSSISCIVPAGATWRFDVSVTASGAALVISATL